MRKFIPVLLLLMQGCTGLGITKPLSLDQQLASAQGAVDVAELAVDNAYKSGLVSVDKLSKASDIAQQARAFIATSHAAAVAGDGTKASSELQLALTALTSLQTYVNSQIPKGSK